MKKKQKHSDLSEAHLEIAGHWAKSDLMPLSARAHFWRPASRLDGRCPLVCAALASRNGRLKRLIAAQLNAVLA